MSTFSIGVVQAAFGEDETANIDRVEALVREAAGAGAQIVLPPELFQGPYFCKTQDDVHFARAKPWAEHDSVKRLSALAAELEVVIPVSLFERDGPHYYNSLVMLDADGAALGVYRKSHIPDGPGYQEKFYFRPGDTGFRTFATRYARIGAGICWDQWFPEAARAMALKGAEALFYPTAIGSEPHDPDLVTSGPWRRVMQGHAVANVAPVAAANRIGAEDGQRFYGLSFIADDAGEIIAELGEEDEGVVVASFDREALARRRAAWGFFRDRRTELYAGLTGREEG